MSSADLRSRLPALLGNAGGGHLVGRLDQGTVDAAVDQVATLAEEATR